MKVSLALAVLLVSCSGGASSGGGCELAWMGSKDFVTATDAAFHRLHPLDQTYVRDVACSVEQTDGRTTVAPGAILISTEHNESVTWYGSTLVHEACHIHRGFKAGVSEEKFCNTRQLQALRRMQAPASEIAHLSNQDGRHVCAIIPTAEGCS